MGAVRRFGFAFSMPFRGAKYVYIQHPGLIRFWIWPLVFVAVGVAAAFYAAWTQNDALVAWMWPEDAHAGLLAAGGRSVLEVLLGVLLSFLGIVIAVAFAGVFASPFNDLLSQRIDRDLGFEFPADATGAGSFLRSAFRDIGVEIAKLAVLGAVLGPLFVLSLVVPVAGPVLYLVVSTLLSAFYWAFDFTDWPWTRRGVGVRARLRRALGDLPTTLGFGLAVGVLLFVPLVQLLVMPAAVAGGTLLVRGLSADEAAE